MKATIGYHDPHERKPVEQQQAPGQWGVTMWFPGSSGKINLFDGTASSASLSHATAEITMRET